MSTGKAYSAGFSVQKYSDNRVTFSATGETAQYGKNVK